MAEEKDRNGKIKDRVLEKEMEESYLDYSMSVIVGRALPDIKDGLKPVHRRILYAMNQMGMHHNKPFKKCARIVGEVLGKYHPHGDVAVYDALVRMVQTFSLRYPLIDGQGNFGSIDGDGAAAMRYTEARMASLSEELLKDIDKKTIQFRPNFDGSLKEPAVLPSKVPNLLINGSSGIAVGMATNIPPHNLNEIVDGTVAMIDNPGITLEGVMEHVRAPDFPTGGQILGINGTRLAYQTGRGSIVVRGKADIEEVQGKERIIITEIPYMVNKSRLIENIADLVKDKRIKGITNIRDESDKDGMRIVIEVSKSYPANIILNHLYKHTQLQTSFGTTLLSLVDNQPKVLSLKEMMEEFIKHRFSVVRKRTKFDLNQASEKAHILQGLLIALDSIDETVRLIKSSKNVEEASHRLIRRFKLSKKQSEAILDMKLQRLTSLERGKITEEHSSLMKLIEELKDILAHDSKIYGLIKKDLIDIKNKYGDDRRTEILATEEPTLEDERLIKREDIVITMSQDDYVKRIPLEEYRQQNRGGKGVIGTRTKEGDIVKEIFVTHSHDYLLCFTNKGKIYWIRAFRIPEAKKYGRGKPIVNLLEVDKDERVKTIIPVKTFEDAKYVFFASKKGKVKKTTLSSYSNPRRGGIIAIRLNEDDDLIDVRLTDGEHEIMIGTNKGYAIRFSEKDVRPMGRSAAGVRGIRVRSGDEVVGVAVVDEDSSLFIVTSKGYGKRTSFDMYRQQNRGGKGVKNLKVTEKTGTAVGVIALHKDDEVMFMSEKGMVIRTFADQISEIGRNTQGVRVMRLNEDDTLASFAKVSENETEEEESS
ncbi:MAG: DNA gyrase subunit A [Candidatus Aenigmarchaeota archaeon]|nr:DNA gyrase subunit A [Candidatus Aenigmarchaeota archaeon]